MDIKLKINALHWPLQKSDNFDFHSNNYIESHVSISKDSKIYTNGIELKAFSILKKQPENMKLIADCSRVSMNEKKSFILNTIEALNKDNFIWMYMKNSYSSNQGFFRLIQNQILRIGTLSFIVREFTVEKNRNLTSEIIEREEFRNEGNTLKLSSRSAIENLMKPEYQLQDNINYEIDKKYSENICRICLSEEFDSNNYLISLCNCSGTMKYIHFNCLKKWITSKIIIESNEHTKIMNLNQVQCELCKTNFPDRIRINNKIEWLIDFQIPQNSNYIFFERIYKKSQTKKCFILINMKGESKLNIGRSSTCHLVIADTSVSRVHGELKIINDHFYITDLDSKFGTFLGLKNEIQLFPFRPMSFIYENFLLNVEVCRKICYFSCCFKKINMEINKNYENMIQLWIDKEAIKECSFSEEQIPKNDFIIYRNSKLSNDSYISNKKIASKNLELQFQYLNTEIKIQKIDLLRISVRDKLEKSKKSQTSMNLLHLNIEKYDFRNESKFEIFDKNDKINIQRSKSLNFHYRNQLQLENLEKSDIISCYKSLNLS